MCAANHEIQMAAVGIALPIAVVDQDLYAAVASKALVGAAESGPRDAKHAVPGRDVIEGADDFREAQLSVIEVDVGGSPVARKKAAAYVLRIAGPVAGGRADSRPAVDPSEGSSGRRHPPVVRVTVVAVRQDFDFSQQCPRGFVAGAACLLHPGDEVAQLNIRAAKPGHGGGSCVLCWGPGHFTPPGGNGEDN